MSGPSVQPAAPPLREFLQTAKRALPGPVHAILGNEAADIDSIACAVALAFAWQTTSDLPTVPVVNMPAADMKLRPEAAMALRMAGLQHTDLVFIDSLDSLSDGLEGAVGVGGALTLVDHNKLPPHQARFADHVRGVIDHHDDCGFHQGVSPRIIERVGSCATLVADLLDASDITPVTDAARLLICAILLDTSNLSPTNVKTTPRDIAAMARLRTLAAWDEAKCAVVYQWLRQTRFAVNLFTAPMLLRRDLKTFTGGAFRAAIASIAMPPVVLAHRASQTSRRGLAACVSKLATDRDVDCVLLLLRHGVGAGAGRRSLAVMKGPVGDALQGELFGDNGEGGIGLDRQEVEGGDGLWWFCLKDGRMSRKIVAPIVTQALERVSDDFRGTV